MAGKFICQRIIQGSEFIELGNKVLIGTYTHIWGHGEIKIGSRMMIASHISITSLTHDYKRADMEATLVKGQVTIEDDVWIKSHSVIMPGIRIGKDAVVGAGSIVTKDIAPGLIVFGVPAKHHKFRY